MTVKDILNDLNEAFLKADWINKVYERLQKYKDIIDKAFMLYEMLFDSEFFELEFPNYRMYKVRGTLDSYQIVKKSYSDNTETDVFSGNRDECVFWLFQIDIK